LQGPTHTLTPSSINTQNRSKNIIACIELSVIGQTLYHTEKQGFGYPAAGFQKKFQAHPPKPAEVEPSFRKVSLPPAKLCMLFPWLREFWPQIYYIVLFPCSGRDERERENTSSHRSWIEAYCPKF